MSNPNGSTLPTDPFRQAVEADVRGQATPRQAIMLAEDPDRQHLILCELKRDLETQYTARKADMAEVKARTLRLGRSGRQEYVEAKAEYLGWKRGADRFKAGVEMAIARVKHAQRQQAQAQAAPVIASRLAEIEDRLAALEAGR